MILLMAVIFVQLKNHDFSSFIKFYFIFSILAEMKVHLYVNQILVF